MFCFYTTKCKGGNTLLTFPIINQNKPIKTNYTKQVNSTASINVPAYAQNPVKTNSPINSMPSFGASQVRTKLSGKEEKAKYNEIVSLVDKETKQHLHELLKNGKLLNANANDNSTVLDNLHKITSNPRTPGLNKEKILSDVINTIHYPYRITQKFGDIPPNLKAEILKDANTDPQNPLSEADLNVHSSTCPAASIEFNLAHKMPAEFARMAEGLTSENISVTKNIKMNELSNNTMDVIWMLNEFKIPHKLNNWNDLTVELKPDRNAIVRARVQNTYQDKGERSSLDVLMQSTFMNVGAENTYNTLNDKRVPKYNEDDGGLTDIEKNFAEEIVTGKGRVCVTYQKIEYSDDPNNPNGKLVGYECKPEETLQHIQDTLKGGDNVIIGYIYCDENNNVLGGHEITITGIEKDKNGNKHFVCNDTDDGVDAPITYPVDELLPKIHHAGIPINVLQGKVEFIEGWKELMQFYKDAKLNPQPQQAQQVITPQIPQYQIPQSQYVSVPSLIQKTQQLRV